MIPYAQLQTELKRALDRITTGEAISIRSWKGDRGFMIEKTVDGFLISEDGYANRHIDLPDTAAVLKESKRIGRREFPRSNRLRFDIISGKDVNHG